MIRLRQMAVLLTVVGTNASAAWGQWYDPAALARLTPGKTAAENALWHENPLDKQFRSDKRVVMADLKGPAVITMIHFAVPESHVWQKPKRLNRDLLIKMYWDGESSPSVDCPLVDFFCDPAGERERVCTALVNKRRGWNAYFPMPFRKSARIELVYDGPVAPGDQLWRIMPCYGYVMYRTLDRLGDDVGTFHAHWWQAGLLLGKRDYVALEARGKGKFIGWNVTIRRPGRQGYPVDENEKFYIDGEPTPSIEFQGLEDSFGFSYGFPPTENFFPLTGYFPFLKGAAAYRFFLSDAISFARSLRVTIGFGKNEHPTFREQFGKKGNELQLSSVVYWYQTEPHAPLPAMPSAEDRAPAPEEPLWPYKEELPSAEDLRRRGVRFHMRCGRPEKEVIFAEKGYAAEAKTGHAWDGWSPPVYHCRASHEKLNETLRIELTVPKGVAGKLRLYVIDADRFRGGRRQRMALDGKPLGTVEDFEQGRWLEHAVGEDRTADGKVVIEATNLVEGANAVISTIEWVEAK